jgi:hypothetical protein
MRYVDNDRRFGSICAAQIPMGVNYKLRSMTSRSGLGLVEYETYGTAVFKLKSANQITPTKRLFSDNYIHHMDLIENLPLRDDLHENPMIKTTTFADNIHLPSTSTVTPSSSRSSAMLFKSLAAIGGILGLGYLASILFKVLTFNCRNSSRYTCRS